LLQKIEHVCGSVSLDDQGHSPHPRGEDLLRQLYACDVLQYKIQFSENWEFPLTVIIGITEKKEKENLHTKYYKAKLE
jgi:hypothetical protein